MADYLSPTPYANPLTGYSNDLIQGLLGYMKDKQRTQQMQGLAGLLESTGIPQTVERAAYAQSPKALLDALTNVNRANVPLLKSETADALMTVAPMVGPAARMAERGAMAAGRAGERLAERVVPQVMERGGLPAQLLQDLGQGSIRPMDVWHGSPHGPFTKFDPLKAGTGEGNASYGEGAYLAQARNTGETYKAALTNSASGNYLYKGKPIDPNDEVKRSAAYHLMANNGDREAIYSQWKPEYWEGKSGKQFKREIEKLDFSKLEPAGYLYKVDLPDESIAKMLDYDKPLSKQAPEVQNALAELGISVDKKKMGEYEDALLDALTNPNATGQLPKQPLDLTGEQILKELERNASRYFPNAMEGKELTAAMINPRAGVSELLAKKGVPGVRYLDQMSRDAGEGTSNFVVFPKYQDLLTIKEINDKPVGGLLGQAKSAFNVTRKDASDIFGAGAERLKYTDPKSGGTMEVLAKPDGTASVLSLEVPETSRGKGIGQSLQAQVMQDFPEMMGQVSSKAAAKTAYRLGRRPPFEPDATLEDVYKLMDENSSVNLVSPEMQKRFGQRTNLLD
jgi:predicted GNAT family acetyltransferase